MHNFKIVFKPTVYNEIQEVIDYYNLLVVGLGERFFESLSSKLNSLKTNLFYQVRYNGTRMATL